MNTQFSKGLKSILPLLLFALLAQAARAEEPKYQTREVEGWTVHINEKLLAEHKDEMAKALELLTAQLKDIVRVVPAEPVTHLKKVALWFNPGYPGVGPRAEYHPDAGWLKSNKRNPKMAKGIEFTDALTFEAEVVRMPVFVLHELAHSYHDQVLGFNQAEIVAAHKAAVANKSYDKVQRWHGVSGKTSIERAYAMTNQMEYFAEVTEAFFGRNDFFPFTREELEKHDPTIFKILQKVWKMPEAANAK